MSFYPHELYRVLCERLSSADAGSSYTRRLAEGGPPRMIRKVVEEAGEVAGAFLEDDPQHLVEEVADLWYHVLVLLAVRGIDPARVLAVLEERHGARTRDHGPPDRP